MSSVIVQANSNATQTAKVEKKIRLASVWRAAHVVGRHMNVTGTEHAPSAFLFHHLHQFVDGVESSGEILLEWSGSHSVEKTDTEISAALSVCLAYIESHRDNDSSSNLVELSIRIVSNYLLDSQTTARDACLQSSCLNTIAIIIGASSDPDVLSAAFVALTSSTFCGAHACERLCIHTSTLAESMRMILTNSLDGDLLCQVMVFVHYLLCNDDCHTLLMSLAHAGWDPLTDIVGLFDANETCSEDDRAEDFIEVLLGGSSRVAGRSGVEWLMCVIVDLLTHHDVCIGIGDNGNSNSDGISSSSSSNDNTTNSNNNNNNSNNNNNNNHNTNNNHNNHSSSSNNNHSCPLSRQSLALQNNPSSRADSCNPSTPSTPSDPVSSPANPTVLDQLFKHAMRLLADHSHPSGDLSLEDKVSLISLCSLICAHFSSFCKATGCRRQDYRHHHTCLSLVRPRGSLQVAHTGGDIARGDERQRGGGGGQVGVLVEMWVEVLLTREKPLVEEVAVVLSSLLTAGKIHRTWVGVAQGVPAPASAASTVPAPASAASTVPAPASAASTVPAPASAASTVPAPASVVSTVPAPASAASTVPAPASVVSTVAAPAVFVPAVCAAVTASASAPVTTTAPTTTTTIATTNSYISTSTPAPAIVTVSLNINDWCPVAPLSSFLESLLDPSTKKWLKRARGEKDQNDGLVWSVYAFNLFRQLLVLDMDGNDDGDGGGGGSGDSNHADFDAFHGQQKLIENLSQAIDSLST